MLFNYISIDWISAAQKRNRRTNRIENNELSEDDNFILDVQPKFEPSKKVKIEQSITPKFEPGKKVKIEPYIKPKIEPGKKVKIEPLIKPKIELATIPKMPMNIQVAKSCGKFYLQIRIFLWYEI